jgi:hypothetical protein
MIISFYSGYKRPINFRYLRSTKVYLYSHIKEKLNESSIVVSSCCKRREKPKPSLSFI